MKDNKVLNYLNIETLTINGDIKRCRSVKRWPKRTHNRSGTIDVLEIHWWLLTFGGRGDGSSIHSPATKNLFYRYGLRDKRFSFNKIIKSL